ncbi:hypothetical protein ACH5RR_029784 [Cinchona calisaya]|uniref:Uncharacterized protein n=1 Tax=Cinchona calisaya TaxID=153742 RepID=A0ABD2YTW7_9GENT
MRRLSYRSGSWCNNHSEPYIRLTRSFLCFDVAFGGILDSISRLFNFKLLRVLDIGLIQFYQFPIGLLKLIHLRFLAVTAACELPSSISELWSLQTFVVYGPWLSRRCNKAPTLPPEIWNMSHLRHVSLSAACYLPDPPSPKTMKGILRFYKIFEHFGKSVPQAAPGKSLTASIIYRS